MRKYLLSGFAGLACCFLAASAALAAVPDLVSTDWLIKNKDNPKIVLLDASRTFDYLDGHIPGAISVSFPEKDASSLEMPVSYGAGMDFLTDTERLDYPFQDRDAQAVQEVFRSWGVNQDSHVVVYDARGVYGLATRLRYSFVYWGFDNVSLLDGGSVKWKLDGHAVQMGASPKPDKGNVVINTQPRTDMLASTDEILAAANNPKAAIFNGLAEGMHYGLIWRVSRPGHIPMSMSMEPEIITNPDRTLKSPEEMRAMLEHFGVTPDMTVYTYCGSGITGTLLHFAIKNVAGYPNVKHYRGSFMAWDADRRELPIWTFDKPWRLRTAGWLNVWPAFKTRVLGCTNTIILDIRSANEYAAGHPQFAINIPYDEFKAGVKNPSALAQKLGASGLDKRYEIVVIGNGVGKETAFAAWALDYLGQANASVLNVPFATWAEANKPTQVPTAIREKSSRFDLVFPPTKYEATLKASILESTAAKTHPYPLVYLDSGASKSAKQPAGTLVHLPSSNVLAGGGILKGAPDLFTLFMKENKLTRLSEIVCIADDPADAALNWYALTLMGFPKVSIRLP